MSSWSLRKNLRNSLFYLKTQFEKNNEVINKMFASEKQADDLTADLPEFLIEYTWTLTCCIAQKKLAGRIIFGLIN